ncbi:MAG: hypothetical protein Q9217_003308 [Psora testacea]
MGTSMQQNPNPFSLPNISNPPPKIFDAQSNNTPPTLPDFGFMDELPDSLDQDGNQGESNEAKRRRIARACDMCRKKKIKCDGGMPACKNCINYKTECIFTQVEKKRNPPKGTKYIEGLENRLGRMETLLKLSGLLNDGDGDRTDLGTLEKRLQNHGNPSSGYTPDRSSKSDSQPQRLGCQDGTPQTEKMPTPKSLVTSPEPVKEKEAEVEELSDMMCSLVTNNCGETRYLGSSSGFSIFSPKGIEWVNEKTGDTSFQDMVTSAGAHDAKWAYWKPEIFGDIFARRTFQPLPPRDEALSLLRDYFDNFNCMFPLFHEPTFMHLVNRNYSRDPYEGSGWWASFNVALAMAHRLRVMSHLVPQEEDKKGWGFLKNAMGVLTELTLRNTDLLSVQALLGMALFLLGTPNPQPSFFLVAAAIRLATSIGLHKRGSGFNLSPAEIEQRKRVFWIAYLLDKDICLRSGRPPAQDDDDMNVELPTEDPSDNIGNIPLADGKGKANLFRFMVTFAIIESKVYKQLYSTKASKQSDGALLNTIGELDKELEEWKDGIPLDFRPEHEIKASHTPLIIHVVVLHFAYYNCLTTIHRMSVHHGYWTSRLSNYAIQGLNARPLNPRVFSSAALCVQAARASIQLIRYIPQGDYSCVWLIIYFPVSALVTLFSNILQNPQDPRARSDVKLMNQAVNFLSFLSVTEEQNGVKRMLGVCSEFERIARVVLEKSDKGSSRHKMKSSKAANGENCAGTFTSQQVPQKRAAAPPTPQPDNAPAPQTRYNSNVYSELPRQPLNPNFNSFSPNLLYMNLPSDVNPASNPNADFGSMMTAASPNSDNFSVHNTSQVPTYKPESPLTVGAFEQPFVPQDLWNMPMTFEWDWADMNMEGMGQGQGQGQRDPQDLGTDSKEQGLGQAQEDMDMNAQRSSEM